MDVLIFFNIGKYKLKMVALIYQLLHTNITEHRISSQICSYILLTGFKLKNVGPMQHTAQLKRIVLIYKSIFFLF